MTTSDQEPGIKPSTQAYGLSEEERQALPLNMSNGIQPASISIQQNSLGALCQSGKGAHTNTDEESAAYDRRNWSRHELFLPVQVTGYDQIDGEWKEVTTTINVSRSGALLRLHNRVRHQTLLRLSLPLPVELRFYQHKEPMYDVYALVLRIEPSQEGKRLVAVEFVGQSPPPGFSERPWATYQTKWNGMERRREPRQERYEPVMVEYFDETMKLIKRDVAITENVSTGGARLYAKTVPFDFTWIKVACAACSFESYAVLCNRYSAGDGYERLCLRFLDNVWPV